VRRRNSGAQVIEVITLGPQLRIDKYPRAHPQQCAGIHGRGKLMLGETKSNESVGGNCSVHHHGASSSDGCEDSLRMRHLVTVQGEGTKRKHSSTGHSMPW
jgi:hypothetical protein